MKTLSQVGFYETSLHEKNRASEQTLFEYADSIQNFVEHLNRCKDSSDLDLENNEETNKSFEPLFHPCLSDLKENFHNKASNYEESQKMLEISSGFLTSSQSGTITEGSEFPSSYPLQTQESIEETKNLFKKGVDLENVLEKKDLHSIKNSLSLEKKVIPIYSEAKPIKEYSEEIFKENFIKTAPETREPKLKITEEQTLESFEIPCHENNIPHATLKEHKLFPISSLERPVENLQTLFPQLQNLVQKRRDMIVQFPVAHPLGILDVRLRFQRGSVSAVFMSHSKNLMRLLGQHHKEIDKIFESFPDPEIRFHYRGDL